MISRSNAVQIWGELAPVPPETVRSLGLASGAAELLVTVGLPLSAEPLFAAVSPSLVESGPGQGTVHFGTDFATMMCVAPPDGPVHSISEHAGLTTRYVNASLGSFVEFLFHTCRVRKHIPDLDDDSIDREIYDLHAQLNRVDPSAFGNPDSWWSVIFEQLRNGLL